MSDRLKNILCDALIIALTCLLFVAGIHSVHRLNAGRVDIDNNFCAWAGKVGANTEEYKDNCAVKI